MKDVLVVLTTFLIYFLSAIFVGLLFSPLWLIIVLAGVVFRVFKWRVALAILWGFITAEWLHKRDDMWTQREKETQRDSHVRCSERSSECGPCPHYNHHPEGASCKYSKCFAQDQYCRCE